MKVKIVKIIMLVIILCGSLFLYMQYDVKKGYQHYIETHSAVETSYFDGKIDLFTEGESLFQAFFQDIKNAQKYVYVHFYIIREDDISLQFVELLKEKVNQGVEVKLSVDYIGNHLSKKTIDNMVETGVSFTNSRSPKMHHFFYSLQHRNHRKLAVIDGEVSYLGGFNIGEEYLGNDRKLGYWKDYHLRVQGNGTKAVERQFAKDWEEDTGELLAVKDDNQETNQDSFQFIFSTGEELEDTMVKLVESARETIEIATPYFIPSQPLQKALIEAKRRGVQMKILLPDETDNWLTKPASYPYIKTLMSEGVEIYFYTKGFFHGKVMMIDNKVADVGTANWDKRSLYLNDESNCLIYNQDTVHEVEQQLKKDFSNSRKVTISYFNEIPIWEKWLMKMPKWMTYYL
ncbi:cardiolipin synthase [Bacillus spongiae]|uniref:Cardiolipin synthase n=1 Tax=Bacillus spongiae TaxID=2683610 RepID=A0ABU8H9C5_9BACI